MDAAAGDGETGNTDQMETQKKSLQDAEKYLI